jgi:sigma-B regulation protein RsbU (phosphoserine phosphatase)
MSLETKQYFTIVYGILDPETLRFRYLSTGHPPLLLQRGGQPATSLEVQNFPVGLTATPEYKEETLQLQPGDRLVLYSDGVVDALECQRPGGIDTLRRLMDENRALALDDLVGRIMSEVERVDCEYPDDNSILALQIGER